MSRRHRCEYSQAYGYSHGAGSSHVDEYLQTDYGGYAPPGYGAQSSHSRYISPSECRRNFERRERQYERGKQQEEEYAAEIKRRGAEMEKAFAKQEREQEAERLERRRNEREEIARKEQELKDRERRKAKERKERDERKERLEEERLIQEDRSFLAKQKERNKRYAELRQLEELGEWAKANSERLEEEKLMREAREDMAKQRERSIRYQQEQQAAQMAHQQQSYGYGYAPPGYGYAPHGYVPHAYLPYRNVPYGYTGIPAGMGYGPRFGNGAAYGSAGDSRGYGMPHGAGEPDVDGWTEIS